jgi:P-type Cu2+ transporter
VWLADATGPALIFEFEEQLRTDAREAVANLQRAGVQVELLSGDATTRAEAIGAALGLDRVHGNATPQDKLDAVAVAQASGHRVLAVGDGLNDAPLLARANVSIAMAHGAALAQSRADFVMTGGQLLGIAQARRLAQRTMRVVRQNMAWAVLYNLVCVPLAMLGMALSSLLVILNAMRLGRLAALNA